MYIGNRPNITGSPNSTGTRVSELKYDSDKLIPGYHAVKAAAIHQGALGCGISGSGPSMFALCTSEIIAEKAGEAMQAAFLDNNLKSDLFFSGISQQGAHILDES